MKRGFSAKREERRWLSSSLRGAWETRGLLISPTLKLLIQLFLLTPMQKTRPRGYQRFHHNSPS